VTTILFAACVFGCYMFVMGFIAGRKSKDYDAASPSPEEEKV
jgi:hypothetical protein